MKKKNYHDIRLKGNTVSQGQRECEERYAVVKKFASRFTRPFTVLDIGANSGYFGFRLAEDFDCVVVMVEARPSLQRRLRYLAKCNAGSKGSVVVLGKKMSLAELERLGEAEHFDMVMALSVLHWFSKPLSYSLELVRNIGSYCIVELANEGATRGDSTVKLRGESPGKPWIKLGEGKSHVGGSGRPILWSRSHNPTLKRRTYSEKRTYLNMQVTSDDSTKRVFFPAKNESRKWIPGINLATWDKLGGIYPDNFDLAVMAESIVIDSERPHRDIQAKNIILGHGLSLIDYNDPVLKVPTHDTSSLKKLIDWLVHLKRFQLGGRRGV